MFPNKKRYKVLAAIPKKDGSSWWMNCGAMFEAKTPNTFNLYLDAMPFNQKEGRVMFHLCEVTEEEMRERAERRNNPGSGSGSGSSYSARTTLSRTDASGSPLLGPDLPLFEPPSRSRDTSDQPPF